MVQTDQPAPAEKADNGQNSGTEVFPLVRLDRPVRKGPVPAAASERGRKLPLTRKVEAVLAALVLALLGAGIASLSTSREAVASDRWVAHSTAVRGALTELLLAATGYESASRGYIVTGDPRHLDMYADAPGRCRARLAELRALTAPDPPQRKRLERLAPILEEKLAWVGNVVAIRRDRGVEASTALVTSDTGRQLMNQVRAIVTEMTEAEARTLRRRSAAHAAAARRAQTLVAVATALDLALVAGVVLVIRRDVTGRRAAEAALREMAAVDPLTELFNRRGFLDHGADLVALAERFDRPVGLFFADLDGLKRINDAFGHAEGDRALAASARLLRATFRSSDVVARWSGDEFVALAVLDRRSDGDSILERLERRQEETNAAGGFPFVLSLSVGAIAVPPAAPLPDLVAQADAEMYRRKRARAAAAETSG